MALKALQSGTKSLFNVNDAINHERTLWGPLLIVVAPPLAGQEEFIHSLKERLIHASIKESQDIYIPVSFIDAINVWSHEDAMPNKQKNQLKKQVFANISIYDRLLSFKCKEQMLITLLFTNHISMEELRTQLATVVTTAVVYNFLLEAIVELRKKGLTFETNEIYLLCNEALASSTTNTLEEVKHALKNKQEVIVWDDGNLHPIYYYKDVLLMASKYGRIVRFIRWGQELEFVNLKVLLRRNIEMYLKTGRYVEAKKIDNYIKNSDSLLTAGDGSAPNHAEFAKFSDFTMDQIGRVYKAGKPVPDVDFTTISDVAATRWAAWTNLNFVSRIRSKGKKSAKGVVGLADAMEDDDAAIIRSQDLQHLLKLGTGTGSNRDSRGSSSMNSTPAGRPHSISTTGSPTRPANTEGIASENKSEASDGSGKLKISRSFVGAMLDALKPRSKPNSRQNSRPSSFTRSQAASASANAKISKDEELNAVNLALEDLAMESPSPRNEMKSKDKNGSNRNKRRDLPPTPTGSDASPGGRSFSNQSVSTSGNSPPKSFAGDERDKVRAVLRVKGTTAQQDEMIMLNAPFARNNAKTAKLAKGAKMMETVQSISATSASADYTQHDSRGIIPTFSRSQSTDPLDGSPRSSGGKNNMMPKRSSNILLGEGYYVPSHRNNTSVYNIKDYETAQRTASTDTFEQRNEKKKTPIEKKVSMTQKSRPSSAALGDRAEPTSQTEKTEAKGTTARRPDSNEKNKTNATAKAAPITRDVLEMSQDFQQRTESIDEGSPISSPGGPRRKRMDNLNLAEKARRKSSHSMGFQHFNAEREQRNRQPDSTGAESNTSAAQLLLRQDSQASETSVDTLSQKREIVAMNVQRSAQRNQRHLDIISSVLEIIINAIEDEDAMQKEVQAVQVARKELEKDKASTPVRKSFAPSV